MEVLKTTDEKGEALLPVYGAGRVDRQGDTVSPFDLFVGMANWAGRRNIRLHHSGEDLPPNVIHPIACFMTGEKPYKGRGYTVPAKTWCLWLRFNLDHPRGRELWQELKAGRLKGLSLAGEATAEALGVEGVIE